MKTTHTDDVLHACSLVLI